MKKLVINDKTLINCYPEYGFVFSMMPNLSNSWVINNFIQIKVIPQWEYFIAFKDHDSILENCPYIKCVESQFSQLDVDKIDIVDYMKQLIDEGKCAFLYLNRFYISALEEYSQWHYIHNTFVVGYDTEKEILYLADNFSEGKYEIIECSYDEFRNALYKINSYIIRNNKLQNKYKGKLIPYVSDMIRKNGKAFLFADQMYFSKLHTAFQFAHHIEVRKNRLWKKNIKIVARYSGLKKYVSCTYEELVSAFQLDPKQEDDDRFKEIAKVTVLDEISLDTEMIKKSLEDYLHPCVSEEIVNGFRVCYGLPAVNEIIEQLKEKKYKHRSFHFLYEHKLIMEKRVEYLMQKGVIPTDEVFLSKFNELTRCYKELRNKAIKYKILGCQENVAELATRLGKLLHQEEEYIQRLISQL